KLEIRLGLEPAPGSEPWKVIETAAGDAELAALLPAADVLIYEAATATGNSIIAANYRLNSKITWEGKLWSHAVSAGQRYLALTVFNQISSETEAFTDIDRLKEARYEGEFQINVVDLTEFKLLFQHTVPTRIIRAASDVAQRAWMTTWQTAVELNSIGFSETGNILYYLETPADVSVDPRYTLVMVNLASPAEIQTRQVEMPYTTRWSWVHLSKLGIMEGLSVSASAFSERNNLLALALVDGAITILDMNDGSVLKRLDDFKETSSLAFSADGRLLASAHGKYGLAVWGVLSE
ncbi:MAG: hypothetical protein U1B80_07455, partial [Anaerolineaceae bacterium]|nr:hypothetical protein [Anaerolineaceae bacterium]